MAVPDWVTYVSLAGGVIGTVSGCMAYRRTGRMKALDLRLELRKADKDLRDLIGGLRDHLHQADISRRALATTSGGIKSGAMTAWQDQLELDLSLVDYLEATMPSGRDDYRGLNVERLESLLVDRHDLRTEAMKLHGKYQTSMDRDGKQREELAAIHREFLRSL